VGGHTESSFSGCGRYLGRMLVVGVIERWDRNTSERAIGPSGGPSSTEEISNGYTADLG
jgi:hypothetical protein